MSVGGFVLISVVIVLEIGHLKKTDEPTPRHPKQRRRRRKKMRRGGGGANAEVVRERCV